MAQQRQPFRFRLPWLAAPQQSPAAPRPSQKTQTQTQQEPAAPRPRQGAQPQSQSAPAVSRPGQGPQAPSQLAPAGPRPSQTTRAPSQTAPDATSPSRVARAPSQPAGSLTQRAPLRTAGMAPTQRASSARAEPSSPSASSQNISQPGPRPRETQPPKGKPASPLLNVSQTQVTSRPASPSQASSKVLQATKAPPQSPSPSRGGTQATKPKATTPSPPTPPQADITSSKKKPLAIKTEVSQNSKELKKRETSKLPSEEAKPVPKTAAPPGKLVDLSGGPKRQPASKEPKGKASTKFTQEVSSPEQERKAESVKEIYTSSYKEPKQVPKDDHDGPKKEAALDKEVQGLEAQTKAHPLANEQGNNSDKEVYDVKEVSKNIENSGRDTEREIHGSERETRLPQKQAVAGGLKASFQKEIKESLPKFVHKNGAQRDKHVLFEKPLSIVTLYGENIGATMHLSSDSPNKKTPIHIHRGYKLNTEEGAETTADGEGSSRKRKSGDTKLQMDLATKSYVNNNVQGLNNSLVFNSSVTEGNPGVHMVHLRNPVEPKKQETEKGAHETHKAEVSSTPAEKLAYAPTVRRRCLRGLLMESSDSDPEKPRRHGCRDGYTQKSKDDTRNLP